ncbi:MAG: class II fructose-bisphosphate aldolase [Candidatus Omnitrophica bacterium]|nr:class II fructose-bisphosphate aldolase [Candidatus Omnitrophota bacterium]
MMTLSDIFKQAYRNRILVPAFNIAYLPMVKPVVDTLKRLNVFGLVEVSRPDITKFKAESYRKVAEEFHSYADYTYVRLHLDHTPVIDEDGEQVDYKGIIKEALELKYDSVMVDGSRLPLDENIKSARVVVEMARPKGIPVEAELGAVLGHEKGPLPPYEELYKSGKGFTDPDEARRFVKESGVSWLSVAVGNIHGAISEAGRDKAKPQARINIPHLKKLKDITGVPLVLHGGSGIKQESILDAIQNGITKINIGTEIRQDYERALKDKPGDVEYAREKVSEKVAYLVKDYYHINGNANELKEDKI